MTVRETAADLLIGHGFVLTQVVQWLLFVQTKAQFMFLMIRHVVYNGRNNNFYISSKGD